MALLPRLSLRTWLALAFFFWSTFLVMGLFLSRRTLSSVGPQGHLKELGQNPGSNGRQIWKQHLREEAKRLQQQEQWKHIPIQDEPKQNGGSTATKDRRTRQGRTYPQQRPLSDFWGDHDWVTPLPPTNASICTPPPAQCDQSVYDSYPEHVWIQSPRDIDYTDQALCITKALSNGPSNTPPQAVHFLWKAPVLEDPDRALPAFETCARRWETRWSIGAWLPDKPVPPLKNGDPDMQAIGNAPGRFELWDRYRASMRGEVDTLNPHYVDWAENEPYLLVLRNAMAGPDGAVADCHKHYYHFVPGACYTTGKYMAGVFKRLKTVTTRPNVWDSFSSDRQGALVYDRVFILYQSYGWEFYHFIAECASKLIYWRNYIIDNDFTVIINSKTAFAMDFIEFAGIKKGNVIQADEDNLIKARLLLVPTPNPCLLSSAMHLRALRDFIHSQIDPVPDEERTILIISRAGATKSRNIINEAEMIAALKERFPQEKFQVFGVMGSKLMSLPDQFRTFNQAKIVLGPHGGGFANMVACRPDTRIIEVSNNMGRNFFLEMAAKLNLELHFITAEAQGVAKDTPVKVNIEELVELLEEMLSIGADHLKDKEHLARGSKVYLSSGSSPICCKNGTWIW